MYFVTPVAKDMELLILIHALRLLCFQEAVYLHFKKLTLSRLELMGDVISARIVKYLQKLFGIREHNIFCFSDSQITLHWVRG